MRTEVQEFFTVMTNYPTHPWFHIYFLSCGTDPCCCEYTHWFLKFCFS